MAVRAWSVSLLAALIIGPAVYQYADPHGGTRQGFEPAKEDSMYPDFSDSDEPTYPMVLVHMHRFPTKDEERDNGWWGSRTVCYAIDQLDGRQGFEPAAAKAEAPCMSWVEPGIGWLHGAPDQFRDQAPNGVVAFTGCYGNVLIAEGPRKSVQTQVEGWDPKIEFLPDDSIRIDDEWVLQPGQALKADYWLVGRQFGNSDDRRMRVAIDYPGRWLVRNVGPMPTDPVTGEEMRHAPPEGREEFGDRETTISAQPETMEAILAPLTAASPGASTLSGLRLVSFDDRLTDVSVTLSSELETVHWYVAGRNALEVRLIGRVTPSVTPGISIQDFQDAFDATPLRDYVAPVGDTLPVVVWWAGDHGLETQSVVPWSETWLPSSSPCGPECAYVWAPSPTGELAWRRHPGPVVAAENALTLAVETVTSDEVRRVYFHHPSVSPS